MLRDIDSLVTSEPVFSPTGLPDETLLEADAIEQRQALLACEVFNPDPERLYHHEQERDEALAELARNLPDNACISIGYERVAEIVLGNPRPVRGNWSIYVTASGVSAFATSASCIDAVAGVLRDWRSKVNAARSLRVVSL